MPYNNVYYGDNSVVAAPYDYSQPIDTVSAPAAEAVADPAMALFDAGRQSFHDGDYAGALQKTDQALSTLPNDTTLHEFRALCLFALGRYDEAAATLYAVLSVGPGWDWTTLISLYPNVDVYTTQLRALENYLQSPPAGGECPRFVLAYHYLTEGFTDAAVRMLKQVATLKPADTLTAKLLKQLDQPKDAPRRRLRCGRSRRHDAARGCDDRRHLGGSPGRGYVDRPVDQAGRHVRLGRDPKGHKQHFAGTSTYGNGILTLAQEKGPVLVGRVSWKGPERNDLPNRRRRS